MNNHANWPVSQFSEEWAGVPASWDTPHVSSSGDTTHRSASPKNSRLSDADVRHRHEFARFAREDGHGEYRWVLEQIYAHWEVWNREFYEGKLAPPHFLLAEPKNPRALGDHSLLSAWGSTNQTRIRPSIIDGSHPQVRSGDEFAEGRLRLVLDIGWHETQHQFQFEVLGKPEQSYRGHGPVFRELCNRVGEKIGLPPVRTAKARGKDRFLPSCAEWPICVRPPGYYLGAFLFEREDVAHEADAEGAGLRPPKALADWLAEHPQWAQRFATVGDGIFVLLDRFFDENPAPATIEKQAVMFLAKAYRHRRRTRPKQTVAAQPALPAPTPVQLT